MSNGVQDSNKWGSLDLISAPVIEAGELATISLRYVSGSAGLAPGGYIEIDTDSDSDWAWPQTQDTSADGYLKVVAPEGRAVSVHTPDHKSMIVALQSGEMKLGESIDIILGDRSGGDVHLISDLGVLEVVIPGELLGYLDPEGGKDVLDHHHAGGFHLHLSLLEQGLYI